MLPAFPSAQKIANDEFQKRIFAAKAEIFPLDLHPPNHLIVEGKSSDYQRDDGVVKPVEMKRHEVSVMVDTKDGKGLTLDMFDQKARELGEGMGKQFWESITAAMDECVKETGNTLTIKKGEFKKEDFLKFLDMGEHSFDENGKLQNTFVMGSSMFEEFKKCQAEWNNDPDFTMRVEDILRRKREEFNEREARRRLVE